MKKLYPLAIAALFLTLSSSAQLTYTAIFPGNWHATGSQTPIWQGAEPPTNCSNCLISLNVNGTVTLNTSVTLTGGSTLTVGGGGASTTLLIGNSGATTFASSYSIMLTPTGNNLLKLISNTDFLNAAGAGAYDGVLQATTQSDGVTINYLKEYGNAPLAFTNNTVTNTGNAAIAQTQLGAATLNGFGTLPIILSAFTAVVDGSQVNLAWTTSLESNSDHFAVQRSTDAGATWTTIGTVAAAGNSDLALNYTYSDTKPAQGTNEYRLQLVDKDGTYKYSTVQSVRLGLVTSVSVYPNPAHDYVNITLGGNANQSLNIRLFNQSGQILQERNLSNAGGTTVPLSVSSYPEGSYIIVVTGADGSRQVNKLLISK